MVTTTVSPAEELAPFVGGFVAAEAHFSVAGSPPKFSFAVGLGSADARTCEVLHAFFGVGSVHRRVRRRPHYDDEVAFQVRALPDPVGVVVPFMDEHLPPSHKRSQYLRWREALMPYWDVAARRRRSCSVAGCDQQSRCSGLCRRHYYVAHGR